MMIEANDVATIRRSPARRMSPARSSTYFNEATLDFLVRGGALRVNMPVELSAAAIATLARHNPVETEALVFGRQGLSLSMRCYHARAYGLTKDACQFVCELDPDGLDADQLDGKPLLVVNGTQTMSHGYAAAAPRARRSAGGGRDAFPAVAADDRHGRRSPSSIAASLDRRIAADEALAALARAGRRRRRSSTATSAAARA